MPSFLKILSNNEEVYKSILPNDLNELDESNENIIKYIPSIKTSNLIKDILKKHNIYSINSGHNMITPLLSALTIKNIEISEILINKRLNINDSTDIRFNPLHFAAYYNFPKIAQLLLDNGANDSFQTKKEGEIFCI